MKEARRLSAIMSSSILVISASRLRKCDHNTPICPHHPVDWIKRQIEEDIRRFTPIYADRRHQQTPWWLHPLYAEGEDQEEDD
jgi:hypothetical protein